MTEEQAIQLQKTLSMSLTIAIGSKWVIQHEFGKTFVTIDYKIR